MRGAGQDRFKDLIRPPEDVMRRKQANIGAPVGNDDMLMSFPSDLGQHYMVLQFFRYNFKNNSFQDRKIHKTISLPIPLNLVEAINVSYAESELGTFQGAVSDMVAQGRVSDVKAAAAEIFETVEGFGGAVGQGLKGKPVQKIFAEQRDAIDKASILFRGGTGATAAGLNRFFGSAPNPHITALFQGVGLRTHQFSWKLAPASEAETHTLSTIINSMRAAMLPGKGQNNLTLKFPDEVEIYIMGTEAKHMYHFKTAVIKTMSTNFAPDGVLSFFGKNGAPTAVNLDIDLTETVIHTREDYEEGSQFATGRNSSIDKNRTSQKGFSNPAAQNVNLTGGPNANPMQRYGGPRSND